MGQGIMGGLGCGLLQMFATTRFVSLHQLIKDKLRCFAFQIICVLVSLIQWGTSMGESYVIFKVVKDSMMIW